LARLATPAEAAPAIAEGFAQSCALQLLQGKLAQQCAQWKAQEISNGMWACAKLGVLSGFVDRAAETAHKWVPGSPAANLKQVAYACRVMQYADLQLMTAVVERSKLLLQQSARTTETHRDIGLVAVVADAVAALDLQQLAAGAKDLVASSGVTHDSRLVAADAGMLWDAHAWLVQHQLLDGKGLAGLLSQQQLEQGEAASAAYHAQQQSA
jgi:hypothetical protein